MMTSPIRYLIINMFLIRERRSPMGYLAILISCIVAGVGYYGFRRRSIWDNIEMGCFNGCLVVTGVGIAIGVFTLVLHFQLNYAAHVVVGLGSFYGSFFFLRFCDYIESRWNHKKEDDPS
ncbi:hypothetical protein AUJ46_03740 [Candidatus Peregrinibacteria bacterium CG1_02_54_53]|nr:MAG: hypothetical protein AUJ46_03740 [Candidatus Peregrinibacteria bacterium CG1_02_54_53]